MNPELEWTGERLVPSIFNEVATEHLARYAFSLSYVQDKNVLDLACGEGYGSFLLTKYASYVTGVDIDHNSIEHARKKYQSKNLTFIEANSILLPFNDESFDSVISFETIEHVKDQGKMLEEISRVLKKGGYLIMSTPNKEVYSEKSNFANPYHEKELNKDEFNTLLKTFFSNVLLLSQRSFYGSLIYSEKNNMDQLLETTGSYQKIETVQPLHVPDYFIAIASQVELPELKPLFFSGQNIFEERFLAFRQTWTYKIGNSIVSPLRWFQRLIKR